MPTQPSVTYSNKQLLPYRNAQSARSAAVNLAANLVLAAGTLLGEVTGITDVQSVHTSAAITAGTYTLGDGTNTTGAINYNDSIATINAKLLAATPAPLPFTASGGPLTTPTDIALTAFGGGVHATLTLTPTGITGGVLSVTHPTVGTAGTPGTFKPYAVGNTDGSQVPKCFLMYPCTVDASGNITITATTGQLAGEFGTTKKSASVYYSGEFDVTNLVGVDPPALAALGARMANGALGGTVAGNNILVLP